MKKELSMSIPMNQVIKVKINENTKHLSELIIFNYKEFFMSTFNSNV
jgi:hypothetical protein